MTTDQLLQVVATLAPLLIAGGAAYNRVTNRLTAIEAKVANGLTSQVHHLMVEGDNLRERVSKLEGRG